MNRKKKLLFIIAAVTLTAATAGAQVGIGTRQPDSSAMLDIVSTTKGVLIPRLVVNSVKHDLDGKAGQPAGLLVYNTGSKALAEGFYYWNGAEWKVIESATAVTASISKLDCGRANLEPPSFSAGKPYMGQLTIPYSGGNGGKYSVADTIRSKNNEGLKIHLRPSRLEHGQGYLVYDVTGTPAKSSPQGATFDIDFKGHKCQVSVGHTQHAVVTSIASVGPLEKILSSGVTGYQRMVTSPDGKFHVRVYVRKTVHLAAADLQVRTASGDATIMWNGHVSYAGGTRGTGGNAFPISSNAWYGTDGENSDKPVTTADAAWGNEDVYYNAPEQRRYIWMTTGTSDNTAYILTFMMGAPSPNVPADDNTARATKAFLRIEQVHAD
ncbi:MAG: hypothetical protein LBI58_07425 [Tannerellaceae bacterium]|jgi:hypothetical protein|nr:hypothetical protein [Tannerellaceae bacterium]